MDIYSHIIPLLSLRQVRRLIAGLTGPGLCSGNNWQLCSMTLAGQKPGSWSTVASHCALQVFSNISNIPQNIIYTYSQVCPYVMLQQRSNACWYVYLSYGVFYQIFITTYFCILPSLAKSHWIRKHEHSILVIRNLII